MPEGPEIKYLSEICKKHIVGLDLYNIISNSKTVVKVPKRSKVIDVATRGKLLILICKDYYFHIHCGLTGWITFENPKYPRYEIEFRTSDDKKMLTAYMDDARRFSKLKILDKNKHQKVLDKLGVDIFSNDFTLDFFIEQIKKTSKKIVAFLMEQNKFCGIGNYIKNESLCRIDGNTISLVFVSTCAFVISIALDSSSRIDSKLICVSDSLFVVSFIEVAFNLRSSCSINLEFSIFILSSFFGFIKPTRLSKSRS
jgi:formamidopyrimidine-DNA glycosylase